MTTERRFEDACFNNRFRLRHLELFQHVCELRTLRQAALACGMTQPGATKLLRELEEMLGVTLFVRTRRGMQITDEGEVVRRHMSVLTADFQNLRTELKLFAAGATGRIRLGIIPSLSPTLLADSLAATLSVSPRITFTLTEDATTPLLAALARNELDLIFGRIMNADQARSLRVTEIYTESFAIVCASNNPLAGRRKLSWSDLSKARWALPMSGTPMREMADNIFLQNGALRPGVAVESSSFHQTSMLIQRSDILGMIPRSLVSNSEGRKAFKVLMSGYRITFAPISIIMRRDFEPAPLVRAFIDTVSRVAAARA